MSIAEFARAAGVSLTAVKNRVDLGYIVCHKKIVGTRMQYDIPESELLKFTGNWRKAIPIKSKKQGYRQHHSMPGKSKGSLTEYMHRLKVWCDEHPESPIKRCDYGQAVLHNII